MAVLTLLKDRPANPMEIAKFRWGGASEPQNSWTDWQKIWHGWLRWRWGWLEFARLKKDGSSKNGVEFVRLENRGVEQD